jgi:hypothetical protein
MFVVVRMKVGGYGDDLNEASSGARCSRVQKIGWVEVVEEEKVGRWKGGLSSRRSEGGCEVIMQFMTLEKLTPKQAKEETLPGEKEVDGNFSANRNPRIL